MDVSIFMPALNFYFIDLSFLFLHASLYYIKLIVGEILGQAGCIAVAQCRGFDYGALIYGGDDVASDEWNSRGWNTRQGIRYNLILLCKELVQEM